MWSKSITYCKDVKYLMFHRATPPNGIQEEENPYLLSFSDILASLLAIFILALVAVMIRLDDQTTKAKDTREAVEQALKELAQVEELRRELLEELKQKLSVYDVQVEINDNHSVLSIPEAQLHFASGRYQIPEDKTRTLELIGEVLLNALQQEKRLEFIDTIFIEGHTDSQPLVRSPMGNWGLSAYRAIAVWQYWTENPGRQAAFLLMHNRQGKPLFSVSGYADTRRLIVPDVTPEAQQKNRRIDLRFTLRTPVTGDLLELLEGFKRAGIE